MLYAKYFSTNVITNANASLAQVQAIFL